MSTWIRSDIECEDEESRFAAFRSELENGARRLRFLVTGIVSVILLSLVVLVLKR